jgi:hypothetical protein
MREVAAEYRLSHWAGIIQERNSSGMSIKAYCKSINVRPNVYFYWQRKLREAACQELLPIALSSDEIPKNANKLTTSAHVKAHGEPTWAVCEVAAPQSVPASSEVTIEIGKSRVAASAAVDLEHLSNICRMLVSIC